MAEDKKIVDAGKDERTGTWYVEYEDGTRSVAIGCDSELYKELTQKMPLLTIELQNESSVPKVFYKGEEVKYKQNVYFDWDTSDELSPGGLTYAIEHHEPGHGMNVVNKIERRLRDHA